MSTTNNARWWREEGPSRFEEFRSWLGEIDIISRTTVRDHIISCKYKSILDAACGPAIDYPAYADTGIEYTGLDMTQKCLDEAPEGMLKVLGSIEEIPLPDKYADVVVARAILEHLDYYELAVNECIRCAKKEVIVIFYKKPGKKEIITQMPEGFYDNVYDQDKFFAFVKSNKRVKEIEWQTVNDPVECDTICYIKLK